MDDLRAAVDRALALTAATRLVSLDAADLVGADHVALVGRGSGIVSPSCAIADPLRLPLIEAVADLVLVRDPLGAGDGERLREMWRILAPAGRLVLVVPLPPRISLKALILRPYLRRRLVGVLAAAMFDLDRVVVTATALVAVAGKVDGLAPGRRRTETMARVAPA